MQAKQEIQKQIQLQNKSKKPDNKQYKQKQQTPMPEVKEQKKEKYYCRFYMQGSCKNEATCKFIHPVNVAPNKKKTQQKKQNGSQPLEPKQKSKQGKVEILESHQNTAKNFKDQYYEKMTDTMKMKCFGCKNKELLVYLSCGCNTICELCVKSKKPCSSEDHSYDIKVYIK